MSLSKWLAKNAPEMAEKLWKGTKEVAGPVGHFEKSGVSTMFGEPVMRKLASPELGGGLKDAISGAARMAKDNKGLLAGAAAIPAAYGAYEIGQPMVDDFMTDQALQSMKRNAKNALVDTVDYAEKHPYMASALMGGAGLAGAELGDQGFAGIFDAVSPFKVGSMVRNRQNRGQR